MIAFSSQKEGLEGKLDLAEKSPTFCPLKRDFPLFRADLCTYNQKWSLRFCKECPLNRGFPLNRRPLNRASTVSSTHLA